MIPYIDFADSKGPLLWLIYGIGYLISPRDFIGVFWIEVIFYIMTFYTLYLCSLRLTSSVPQSLTATVIMAVAYFFPSAHTEMRAEDFCQLFFAITLYSTLSLTDDRGRHNLKRSAICLGICFGATLMIKYNVAAMLASVSVPLLFSLRRDIRSILRFITCYIIGAAIVIIPFVIALTTSGSLTAFVNEYFISTYNTLEKIDSPNGFIANLTEILSPRIAILVIIPLAGIILYRFRNRTQQWTVIFWFAVSLLILARLVKDYYFSCLATFWIFGIIYLLNKFGKSILTWRIPSITAAITIIVVSCLTFAKKGETNKLIFNIDSDRAAMMDSLNFYMSQVTRPTIIYYNSIEYGESVFPEALPGSRYWAIQVGASDDMRRQQELDVLSGKSDFVEVSVKDTVMGNKLEEIGYHPLMTYYKYQNGNIFRLYGRK
ncbi:MAG: glycosyltransferase family 39 protein [Pseudoflavonifractor sp.]|nr:glycosyltransferase family 39 protein [Pseudoflavonifractor sp.]